MAEKGRKSSSEDKVRILRRHLLEKVPLSDLCDEYGLHPTVFYRWQKTSFEKGVAEFANLLSGVSHPAGVRSVGRGAGANGVVCHERVARQRVRELEAESPL